MTARTLTPLPETGLSCHGTVAHARGAPRRHVFRYPVWMLCVDLERLPDMPGWLRCLAGVDGDHLLAADAVRARLAANGIEDDGVRVLALTQPGAFGHSFNPVNFYFCERTGTLAAALLEVTNTPWGEQHVYVLDGRRRPLRGRHRFHFPKTFHVSPFLAMEGSYDLRFELSAERMRVVLGLTGGSAPFSASLSLRARPITRAAVLVAALRRPAQNAVTLGRIYWQAARLFAKRTPFFPHPRRTA